METLGLGSPVYSLGHILPVDLGLPGGKDQCLALNSGHGTSEKLTYGVSPAFAHSLFLNPLQQPCMGLVSFEFVKSAGLERPLQL